MNYPRSAYIHIPFCHRRCFYCDFPIVPLGDRARGEDGSGSNSIKSYLKLLHKEISLSPKAKPLSTVYIGGGTPSLLSASQVANLLEHLRSTFGFQDGAEITLEIDPASFDDVSLNDFLISGINRISLGAQSFDDNVLAQLGRRHTFNQLLDSCKWINESFRSGKLSTWNLDLIQNLPGRDLSFWRDQLLIALSMSPPHLSIYDLSIEEGTVFSWRRKRGELCLPSEEVSSEISKMTSQIVKQEGLARYEISNYALPGHASRHNRVYWSGAGWWAFGQGATSCPWGKRLARPRTRAKYQKWVEDQALSGIHQSLKRINGEENCIPIDELLIVGLRRREGVDIKHISEQLGWDMNSLHTNMNALKVRLENTFEEGLIKQRGYRFFLTDPDGMNISNQILVEILLWLENLNLYCVD